MKALNPAQHTAHKDQSISHLSLSKEIVTRSHNCATYSSSAAISYPPGDLSVRRETTSGVRAQNKLPPAASVVYFSSAACVSLPSIPQVQITRPPWSRSFARKQCPFEGSGSPAASHTKPGPSGIG